MRAQKIIEQDIKKRLRELFLLTDEWYRSRGEELVRSHSKDSSGSEELQHYGAVSLGSQYDPHWDDGFWNVASLTLRAGKGYHDISVDTDELERLRRDYKEKKTT